MSYIIVHGSRIDVPYEIAVDLVDQMTALTRDDCVVAEWTDETRGQCRLYLPYETPLFTVLEPESTPTALPHRPDTQTPGATPLTRHTTAQARTPGATRLSVVRPPAGSPQ
ncbi:hypothetical protein [Rhodococcus koreensis]